MKREPSEVIDELPPPQPLSPPAPRQSQPVKVTFPDEMAVRVVDIKMPFWSMVGFMVKWAIASIPAFLILFLIGALVLGVLGGMGHSSRL